MNDNTKMNIRSNAEHAVVEAQGILSDLENPNHIWHSTHAAIARLSYIATLLTDAGHPDLGP